MRYFSLVAFCVLLADGAGAALRPHPRIEMDAATLKTIRSLRDSGHPAWMRYAEWTKRQIAAGGETNAVLACSLMHLVEGSREYFDCAWDKVRARVYRNGRDNADGIVP